MSTILDGVKVLSWAIWHAGSCATAFLGDMGAEVIKIEQPGWGDILRGLMEVERFCLAVPQCPDRNAVFEYANRNTKSMTLDLSQEKGREVLFRLLPKVDIFFTNMYQTAQRFGMDYATLRQHNPRLIYSVITGYGSQGPDKDQAGYDPQGLAKSGLMHRMGNPPQMPQFAILDQAAALMSSYGMVAALLARERTGEGQEIHVSLLSTGISLLAPNLAVAGFTGQEFPFHNRNHTSNPLRNYYRCADSKWILGAHTPPDRYWPHFCQALGVEYLEHDPRFETTEKRRDNSSELVPILDGVFATRTRDEWIERFKEFPELSFMPINTVIDVLTDPQVVANNYIADFQHPILGKVRYPAFPVEFGQTPTRFESGAPEVGQHTEEVLLSLGDYTWDEIASLDREGII
jgi:crotonobetainyl-CoA:carnitine CoA-transferase CaiB-like acyl-CoA transferase